MRSGPYRAVAQTRVAVLAAERVELLPQVAVRPLDLLEERRPVAPVGDGIPRRERRDGRILDLGRIARGDPDPRPPGRGQRGETDDVVLDDHVGRELVDDLGQARMDVHRAIDEGAPGRRHELAELLDRRLAEDRRRVADEVDPELARDLVDLGLRPEAHQPLLEALCLERPGERLLDDEDDAMASRAKHLADPDAVVGRAERTLREEDDRPRVSHGADYQAGSTSLRRRRASGDQGTTARSTTPTARYSATETIAVSRIAANTRSVRKLFCDNFIQMPRPSVAPTYSPKMAPMTA